MATRPESRTVVPHSKTLTRSPRAPEIPTGLGALRDGTTFGRSREHLRVLAPLDVPAESGTVVPHAKTLRGWRGPARSGEAFGVRRRSEAETALSTAQDAQRRRTPPEPRPRRGPLALALQTGLPETAPRTVSLVPYSSNYALTSAFGSVQASSGDPNRLPHQFCSPTCQKRSPADIDHEHTNLP
jgi:hypothetical protein